MACAHIDGVASVLRFRLDEKAVPNLDIDENDDDLDKIAATAESGHHGEELFSYLDYEEACRVVKFNQGWFGS